MTTMFSRASSFNQDISKWNVANVTDFALMFASAALFNHDISTWDVSKAVQMQGMFSGAISFNQDISSWDVSMATNMLSMFSGATSFNQDISSWNVSKVENMERMFHDISLSIQNYNSILTSWSELSLQNDVEFSAGNSKYCGSDALAARQSLIEDFGWNITDGGDASYRKAETMEICRRDLPINLHGEEIAVDSESGTYEFIFNSSTICDSIIVVDLTINESSESSITESATGNYTSPSGKTYTSTGTYTDTILNSVGCDSIITITLTMLSGLDNYENRDQLKVFPNPVDEELTLEFEKVVTGNVKVFDVTGKLVLTQNFCDIEKSKLLVGQFESGMYQLVLDLNGERKTCSFIKR